MMVKLDDNLCLNSVRYCEELSSIKLELSYKEVNGQAYIRIKDLNGIKPNFIMIGLDNGYMFEDFNQLMNDEYIYKNILNYIDIMNVILE